MTNDKDISWQIVIGHIQKAAKDNRRDLKDFEERLNKRFDTVDEKLASLEFRVNLLFTQTTNLSEGMDYLEIKEIPNLKESIRRVNKRLSDHVALPSHQPALKA